MLLIFNVLETLIPKPLLEDARCANETHLGCSDNTCVPAEYFCDGSSDCEDSSDEVIIQNCIIIIFFLVVSVIHLEFFGYKEGISIYLSDICILDNS